MGIGDSGISGRSSSITAYFILWKMEIYKLEICAIEALNSKSKLISLTGQTTPNIIDLL